MFYNEAAELLIGRPFVELGEIPSLEFGETLQLADADGIPLRRRDSPAGVAFFERRPSHQVVFTTAYDGAASHGRGDGVPALRRRERHARCTHRLLGAGRDEREALMQARVWGCRGSLAAPGPDTVRYGGNTSCVEVRLDSGPMLVLDAGTGMRPLSVAIDHDPVDELHIMLTHLHMDHLQGLGFFRPLFRPGETCTCGDRLARAEPRRPHRAYLSPPLFPVCLGDIPARVTFHDAAEGAVTIGSATIRAGKVTHQGPTVDTASRRTGGYSSTSRIMSRPSESISPMSCRHGSAVTTRPRRRRFIPRRPIP